MCFLVTQVLLGARAACDSVISDSGWGPVKSRDELSVQAVSPAERPRRTASFFWTFSVYLRWRCIASELDWSGGEHPVECSDPIWVAGPIPARDSRLTDSSRSPHYPAVPIA